jgi:hypothetical protein
MADLIKVYSHLGGRNLSRLKAKKYNRPFTNIPNSVLPKQMFNELNVVYEAMTGDQLPVEDYTFLVKADENGKFKRFYIPGVYRNDETLIIKWGDREIPLELKDSKITIPGLPPKSKIAFKEEKWNGYDTVVLSVTFTKDGDSYNLVFSLKFASLDDEYSPEHLEMLLENDKEAFLEIFARPNSGNGESSQQLEGPVVKLSALPIGEYKITAYRSYSNSYGVQHLVQTSTNEPFEAETRVKNEKTGEWESQKIEIVGKFIAKANNKLNSYLLAEPIFSEENPGVLKIVEKSVFNGYPAVKIDFFASDYKVNEELFNVDF